MPDSTLVATLDAQAGASTVVSQLTVPAFDGNNIWRSAWADVGSYRRLTGIVASNQPLHVQGVVIGQSIKATLPAADATSDPDEHYPSVDAPVSRSNPLTGIAYYSSGFSIDRIGRWARIVVRHNGVVPGTFFAALIGANPS